MSTPAAISRAPESERRAVVDVLHDAFVDEDGLNYWLRQGAQKEKARRRFFEAAVRDAVHPKREMWLAHDGRAAVGAALWLPPGAIAFDHTLLQQVLMAPLLYSIAGGAGLSRARDLGARLAAHHPRQPHAHLVFLGVASAAQGRGVGSSMLKTMLAPLDAHGLTAYLEASKERNVALYQRHGFEVTGAFELPGLRFWTMTRHPRG